MKKRPIKRKKAAKGLTKRDLKRILIFASAGLGLIILVALVVYLSRPRLLWYVDEDISAAWARILRESPAPFSRFQILPRTGSDPFPQGRFGFTISRIGPQGERVEGTPVLLYRDLVRTRSYNDWYALALDPWMVFRKHYDPEPGRSFLSDTNERGSILLAGLDQDAVQAWLCQLLQISPGVFEQDA